MARILIVDDDSEWAQAAAELLAEWGHSVATAPNGLAGLHLLARQHVDLVIIDMQMPMMSGTELLTELRKLPRHKSTPVVAVSAIEGAFTSDPLDADATLVKPISAPVLREVLTRLLNKA